ncbi:MAG: aminopeptidase [Firmicutes bacterium]|nr:aminopeptidase [Bacillota bacterium]
MKDLSRLRGDAARILETCLGVKEGEEVLVVTDEPLREIGELLWRAAKDLGADASIIEIIPRATHGQEPPEMVAEAMKKAAVVLAPTSKSLSHTAARKAANEAGARIFTLPGILPETLERAVQANYEHIAEIGVQLADILTKGKTARVTTPAGTDITMSLEGRKGHPDTGLVREPGLFSNFPAGEAFIAPVEGTANGIFVVDGSMSGAGVLENEKITFNVKEGYVTDITGGEAARRIVEIIKPFGKAARNIAELGIGINDQAQLCGSPLEDEKVLGTAHIAIGDNKTFGGNTAVPSHLDGIMLDATIEIDGVVIMEDGKLKL